MLSQFYQLSILPLFFGTRIVERSQISNLEIRFWEVLNEFLQKGDSRGL